MAQEQTVLGRIDWQSTFAFTRLFTGFRSALHSTRILLALGGLFLTFLLGGILDSLWVKSGQGVWPGEIMTYIAAPGHGGLDPAFGEVRRSQLGDILVRSGVANRSEAEQRVSADACAAFKAVKDKIVKEYWERRKASTAPETQAQFLKDMQRQLQDLDKLQQVGPFREFATYQLNTARNAVFAAAQFRFTDGLDAVLRGDVGGPPGVLASLLMLWLGLVWLMKVHWFYSVVFIPCALAIWALAGGGISRAAVMQFTKDERIGIREALRFGATKFWGFFFAPLVSLGFVLALGLLLTAGGLLGSIPVVGDVLVGLLWFLALLGGLGIAFITIGMLTGGHLFSPVIAAEGSDAFDAISRGFVYVYSRPWKSILYGLTLVVYGSLCYLFLRFFVWLMLVATHAFVGLGMFRDRPEAGSGMEKLDVVWRTPTFLELRPQALEWHLLGFGESVLFLLIAMWTYIIWGLLQSWMVSFYFTGSSVAYLLLRKDVDAIDFEEIYVEEEPEAETIAEAPTPIVSAPAPAPATPTTPAPAVPPPPVAPPPPPPAESGPTVS